MFHNIFILHYSIMTTLVNSFLYSMPFLNTTTPAEGWLGVGVGSSLIPGNGLHTKRNGTNAHTTVLPSTSIQRGHYIFGHSYFGVSNAENHLMSSFGNHLFSNAKFGNNVGRKEHSPNSGVNHLTAFDGSYDSNNPGWTWNNATHDQMVLIWGGENVSGTDINTAGIKFPTEGVAAADSYYANKNVIFLTEHFDAGVNGTLTESAGGTPYSPNHTDANGITYNYGRYSMKRSIYIHDQISNNMALQGYYILFPDEASGFDTTGYSHLLSSSNYSNTMKFGISAFTSLGTDATNQTGPLKQYGHFDPANNISNIIQGGFAITYDGKNTVLAPPPLPPPTEEEAASAVGVVPADITALKTGTFTPTDGKATLDSTRKAKLKTLIDGAATAAEKRNMRRIVLKLLFAQNANVKKMVIPKEDLDLPVEFTKPNVVVVKSGETTIAISALGADEGFYSVLNDGETFKVTTANTTLTFTRTDVDGAEIYGVAATTWSRPSGSAIIINSDSVTGTFTSALNTGTLLPDDKVIIDGRLFIIGSVADGGTSGSGADPYVYPINSSVPVKLPNKCATYRMFEQGDNYVNVEVGRATDDHQERMIEYAEKLTPVTHNIVCDGYFYRKAFISAEGHTLSVDYTDKKVRCNSDDIKFFTIKQSKKKFSCGEFSDDSHCMTVAWETKEGKKIHTEIMFFPNPHIENGINVIPETTVDSTGLIVTNYKPKLMTIPSISTEKYGKLWKRLRNTNNKFQYKSIKGKNEKWHKH
jgi:hypothetical protein